MSEVFKAPDANDNHSMNSNPEKEKELSQGEFTARSLVNPMYGVPYDTSDRQQIASSGDEVQDAKYEVTRSKLQTMRLEDLHKYTG